MKSRILSAIAFIILVFMPFNLMADEQMPVGNKAIKPGQMDDTPILKPRPDGFQYPYLRIRHDWTDVLNSEDLSQTNTGRKKAYGDLVGATISYSHNGVTSSDTWTAVGSLIIPYVKYWDLHRGYWPPVLFAIAPSVSINRVSTNGNTSNEVDHLDYRLGFYGKWLPQKDGFTGFLVRGAFVYGTDIGHHASLPAVEIELEPQFWWESLKYGIGYSNVLIKNPTKKGESYSSWMDLQFRGWLHIEGGDLQRNGAKWETVDDSFFRVGPTVQGVVNFPELLKGFSVTAQYGYLPTISGPSGNNSLFKVGGAFTLYQDRNEHQKISLTTEFTKGGLTLSKQEVEVFNIGIGVVF
jgi:hypothetical protein